MALAAFVVGITSAMAAFLGAYVPSLFTTGRVDVFPLPASDCSGKRLHVQLGHAVSGSDGKRALHHCNLSRNAVGTSQMRYQ